MTGSNSRIRWAELGLICSSSGPKNEKFHNGESHLNCHLNLNPIAA